MELAVQLPLHVSMGRAQELELLQTLGQDRGQEQLLSGSVTCTDMACRCHVVESSAVRQRDLFTALGRLPTGKVGSIQLQTDTLPPIEATETKAVARRFRAALTALTHIIMPRRLRN